MKYCLIINAVTILITDDTVLSCVTGSGMKDNLRYYLEKFKYMRYRGGWILKLLWFGLICFELQEANLTIVLLDIGVTFPCLSLLQHHWNACSIKIIGNFFYFVFLNNQMEITLILTYVKLYHFLYNIGHFLPYFFIGRCLQFSGQRPIIICDHMQHLLKLLRERVLVAPMNFLNNCTDI